MKISVKRLKTIISETVSTALQAAPLAEKACPGCKGKKPGLWCNICRKRARGERPARPGGRSYPKTLDVESAVSEYGGMNEDQPATKEKPGSEKADVKGSLDVKKIATTLGVDPDKLSTAVKAARSGTRTATHNAVLGDVFVKLMEANPNDTVTVMNVLKRVVEK